MGSQPSHHLSRKSPQQSSQPPRGLIVQVSSAQLLEIPASTPTTDPSSRNLIPEVRGSAKNEFLRPASDAELHQVAQLYSQHPMSDCEVYSVEVVENSNLERLFEASLKVIQYHKDSATDNLIPKWVTDEHVSERFKVFRQLSDLAARYANPSLPSISLLPVWIRAQASEVARITEFGFVRPTTSKGLPSEEGITTTCEASHAWLEEEGGKDGDVLFMSWVGIGSAYPVVREGSSVHVTKSKFSTYDGVFIPVTSSRKSDDDSNLLSPTFSGDESPLVRFKVVVLEPAQCLPAYVIRLRPTKVKRESSALYEISDEGTTMAGSWGDDLATPPAEKEKEKGGPSSGLEDDPSKVTYAVLMRSVQQQTIQQLEALVEQQQQRQQSQSQPPDVLSLSRSQHQHHQIAHDRHHTRGGEELPPMVPGIPHTQSYICTSRSQPAQADLASEFQSYGNQQSALRAASLVSASSDV